MNIKKLNEKLSKIINETKQDTVQDIQEKIANLNTEIKTLRMENTQTGFKHKNNEISYEEMSNTVTKNRKIIESKLLEMKNLVKELGIAIKEYNDELLNIPEQGSLFANSNDYRDKIETIKKAVAEMYRAGNIKSTNITKEDEKTMLKIVIDVSKYKIKPPYSQIVDINKKYKIQDIFYGMPKTGSNEITLQYRLD